MSVKIIKTMPTEEELRKMGYVKVEKYGQFGISTNVHARIWDDDGNLTYDKDCGHNTVTDGNTSTGDNGRIFILERLFKQGASIYTTEVDDGTSGTDANLNIMELGWGSANDNGLGSPVLVNSTQITISGANTVLDYSSLTAPFMTLSGIWNNSNYPYALSGITEIVLLSNSYEVVFAYKNSLGSLSKTALGALQIDWSFTVTQP